MRPSKGLAWELIARLAGQGRRGRKKELREMKGKWREHRPRSGGGMSMSPVQVPEVRMEDAK